MAKKPKNNENEPSTSSRFANRKSTACHNYVKQILYKNNITTKDMLYSQQNESEARTLFIEDYIKTVRPAGLYIDEGYGFLGANPDGVVMNEESIVEIKCLPSLARLNEDIENAAKSTIISTRYKDNLGWQKLKIVISHAMCHPCNLLL